MSIIIVTGNFIEIDKKTIEYKIYYTVTPNVTTDLRTCMLNCDLVCQSFKVIIASDGGQSQM